MEWWDSARSFIPGLSGLLYFNTAGAGPACRAALEACLEWIRWMQENGPASPAVHEQLRARLTGVRKAVAQLLGCGEGEVALTRNATEGINIVAWGQEWRRGDEVVLTNHEHPGNLIPWYNLAQRLGLRIVMLNAEPGADLIAQLQNVLSGRTRMIAISHVSRRTGRLMPVAEIARMVAGSGIRVLVDGAQGPGNVAVNVRLMGCDYYTCSGHKWLLGPPGCGALYVAQRVLEDTRPTFCGSHSQEYWDFEGGLRWLQNAARYEYGTQEWSSHIGWEAALRWLAEVGWERIWARRADLMAHLADSIRESRVGRLVIDESSGEYLKSGILAWDLPVGDVAGLCRILFERYRILASPLEHQPSRLRVSVHFFNMREEVDRLVRVIRDHVAT